VPILEGYDHVFLRRDGDRDNYRTSRIPSANHFLRDGRFDWVLIHGYVHPFERQAVLAAKATGVKVVMRGEFTDAPRPGRRWWVGPMRAVYLKWFYRHVEAFCYLGTRGREHLLAHGIPPGRMFHSPYSVDTDLFEGLRSRWSRSGARAALGIPDDRFVVLFSGKLIHRKAPLVLTKATRRVGDNRLHLTVLGDGPLRAEVEAAARGACGPRVTLPGFVNQSDLGRYFAAADVFVLPSEFETWGLVVNEAMQFGLPAVVSSAVGCHPDLIVPGQTGFVFPTGDVEALADCLLKFLDDPNLAAQMGAKARTRISEYTSAAAVDGIRQAITASVSAPSPPRPATVLR
jgi:glycosyltransferase involved in cell wall biosynthesis